MVETDRTCRREFRQFRRTCHTKTVTFLINDAGMMKLWAAIERIYTMYYNNIHTNTLHVECIQVRILNTREVDAIESSTF